LAADNKHEIGKQPARVKKRFVRRKRQVVSGDKKRMISGQTCAGGVSMSQAARR
jgi:hypothetical protein